MSEEIIKLSTEDISNHPGIIKAIEVYFENGKSIDEVERFFSEDYSCAFPKGEIEKYFNKMDQDHFLKIKKETAITALQKQSLEMDSQASNRVIMIQEMAWDRMATIYTNTEAPVTKEQKNTHIKQTKEFCDLAKLYREFHQMRLEIMTMGKTEEEAKLDMQAYVATVLKDAVGQLSEFPDAQNKLSALLNFTVQEESEGEGGE